MYSVLPQGEAIIGGIGEMIQDILKGFLIDDSRELYLDRYV